MRIRTHSDANAKRQGRHYTPFRASCRMQLDDSVGPNPENSPKTGLELLKLG